MPTRARDMGSSVNRAFLSAVIVSRLAEGESLETVLSDAGLSLASYREWRESDGSFAAATDDADLNGALFLFHHERYELERRREDLLTRYIVATATGDLSSLPPDLHAHSLSLLPRAPAPGFEYSPRVGGDGILRRHLWQERKPPKKSRPLCGAKTRCGGSCSARVVPGKTRCRLHGGLSRSSSGAPASCSLRDDSTHRQGDESLYDQARLRARLILRAMHMTFCLSALHGEATPDPSRSARV